MLGLTEYLHKQIASLSTEEVETSAQVIHDTVQSLYGLLENLLEWTRIQKGNFNYEPENLDVYYLVENLRSIIRTNAHQKNIEIVNKVEDGTEIWADFQMINTVLRNLLFNSIKFTEEGGRIEIEAKVLENKVEISVQDNGIGMSEEMQDNLFSIDKEVTRPGTNKEKGSGLGLILCKEIITIHGGVIWTLSEEGEGTRFSFTVMPGRNDLSDEELKIKNDIVR